MKKATAKKKTPAKKKSSSPRSAVSQSFDILSSDGERIRNVVHEALASQADRSTARPTFFKSMAEVRQDFVPVDHFLLQYLFDSVGYPLRSFIQLLGDSKLGKTTMGHYMLGCAVRHLRCPVLAIHWAPKPFMHVRAIRTYSAHPMHAELISSRIDVSFATTLAEMELELDNWVRKYREVGKLPKSVPLVILVDNVTKYLPPEEAQGVVDWGDYNKEAAKKKKKETAGGSNFTSAKWFQAWTRRLGDAIWRDNLTVIAVADQNDDIDMSGGGGGMTLPEKTATLYNDTHRGGRGLKQMASSRLIFGYDSLIKNPDGQTNRGFRVNIRNAKSNFGADERKIRAELRLDHSAYDVPGAYLDPAWHMDDDMGIWFVNNGYFGTSLTRGRYTSERLGVFNGTAEDLSKAFHGNEELKQELGRLLRIQGYFDVVDQIVNVPNPEENEA